MILKKGDHMYHFIEISCQLGRKRGELKGISTIVPIDPVGLNRLFNRTLTKFSFGAGFLVKFKY